jgi:DNA-binding transcriptional ArsR family regulator
MPAWRQSAGVPTRAQGTGSAIASQFREQRPSGLRCGIMSKGSIVDEFTYSIYFLHAQILRTLAQPTRLMILDYLHAGEKSVGELVESLGLAQATVSQHLAALRTQEVVATRREGNTIFYSLVDERVVRACDLFHEFLADRMKDNEAFASQFPRVRPLRATKPPSAGEAAESSGTESSPKAPHRRSG